ncbi:hypothetical protein BT96DRAFT_914263 [Gymnopus androsaceus JB14]|uniref:Uncharacterized protein n=1 Tax=Gymnopus androsaceus JB14 TaxID=1447944 RepID=A0A6A4IGZ0_9AGAR|nr:hypothetical protein BT96DRAFT_914263 [Gymnopus androsaceus JB14]
MVDINPQFCPRPRVLQDLPNGMRSVKGKGKEKSKSKSKPSGGGILNFFGELLFLFVILPWLYLLYAGSKPYHTSSA